MKRKVRVLIIEGSAVTRRILTAILAADRELEVAGAVPDLHEKGSRLAGTVHAHLAGAGRPRVPTDADGA